ncbi:unnamed protein product [Taenia asiatica]|uniref:MgtE domain-containing protein n=1 Tax=Taenia asiatica TaxID=60517 RepID=A0A0R3VUD0_TAEAS|nr:unnamed protein product [Taenia asiatica]
MVFHKKKQQQINDGVTIRPPKSERLQYVRRSIHRNSDILLILLHSLFPLAVGAFLVAQEALANGNRPHTGILGYLTGCGGIILQITLIARTLAPSTAARVMDVLTICVSVLQFLSCTVGAFVFLAVVGKAYLVTSVSLANAIFCILPTFLAVTSIIAERKGSEGVGRSRNEPLFASSRSHPPIIVRGESNKSAGKAKTNKVGGLGGGGGGEEGDVVLLRMDF